MMAFWLVAVLIVGISICLLYLKRPRQSALEDASKRKRPRKKTPKPAADPPHQVPANAETFEKGPDELPALRHGVSADTSRRSHSPVVVPKVEESKPVKVAGRSTKPAATKRTPKPKAPKPGEEEEEEEEEEEVKPPTVVSKGRPLAKGKPKETSTPTPKMAAKTVTPEGKPAKPRPSDFETVVSKSAARRNKKGGAPVVPEKEEKYESIEEYGDTNIPLQEAPAVKVVVQAPPGASRKQKSHFSQLQRSLEQIREIEQRLARREQLTGAQLEKLGKRVAVEDELKALELQIKFPPVKQPAPKLVALPPSKGNAAAQEENADGRSASSRATAVRNDALPRAPAASPSIPGGNGGPAPSKPFFVPPAPSSLPEWALLSDTDWSADAPPPKPVPKAKPVPKPAPPQPKPTPSPMPTRQSAVAPWVKPRPISASGPSLLAETSTVGPFQMANQDFPAIGEQIRPKAAVAGAQVEQPTANEEIDGDEAVEDTPAVDAEEYNAGEAEEEEEGQTGPEEHVGDQDPDEEEEQEGEEEAQEVQEEEPDQDMADFEANEGREGEGGKSEGDVFWSEG
eukprot:GGOE01019974.1.p1 GENE.GGOE01019974.1~~GGOE01019974.1.p1  ORF type:complete len:577 (+),score=106.90 GGOE01019974.1:25-1731(+)